MPQNLMPYDLFQMRMPWGWGRRGAANRWRVLIHYKPIQAHEIDPTD